MWVQVMRAELRPLQDMTGMDCVYEGIMVTPETLDQMYGEGKWGAKEEEQKYLADFADLIDDLNGAGSWTDNPLTWRYELKRVAEPT